MSVDGQDFKTSSSFINP